jgi:hypothetical protein
VVKVILNIDLQKTADGFKLNISTNLFLLAPMMMLVGNAGLASIIQILLQAYDIWFH